MVKLNLLLRKMITIDSEIKNRKSIRLPGHDYSSAGAYFVTICTQNREYLLGKIIDNLEKLNEIGKMILWHWRRIPSHFPNVKLDEIIVMPNHPSRPENLTGCDAMITLNCGSVIISKESFGTKTN